MNSFACYLSTSAGPVMGVLYVSTAKLAFCSDDPLSYKSGDNTDGVNIRWLFHYINSKQSILHRVEPIEQKNISRLSVDNHGFWYMGFLNYDGAVKCLQDVLQARHTQWCRALSRCEPFPTYPRTYDLVHAEGLISLQFAEHRTCEALDLFAEIDRLLRPEGWVILRDNAHLIEFARSLTTHLKWEASVFVDIESNSDENS